MGIELHLTEPTRDGVEDGNESDAEVVRPEDVLEEIVLEDGDIPEEDEDDELLDEEEIAAMARELRAAFEGGELGSEDEEGEDGEEGEWEDEETREPVPSDAIATFRGHTDAVYCVAVDPTGALAATGGGDDKGFVWNILTGELVLELAGHTDSITAIAFNGDGKNVATGGMEGIIYIWDVAGRNPKPIATLEGPDEITWLTYHPRGNVLLAGASDGNVWMWSSTGATMQVFSGHSAPVEAGAFTPDGKQAVSVSEDGVLYVWDPKSGTAIHRISHDTDGRFHNGPLTSLAVSPDSTLCMSGSEDDKVAVYHLQQGRLISVLDHHEGPVEALGFSPVHPFAASGGLDGKLIIYDTPSMRMRHKLSHDDSVCKLIWHPTQPYVITASVDRKVRVWDARNGQCVKTLQGHNDAVLDAALTKDGQYVVSVGDDKVANVFRL